MDAALQFIPAFDPRFLYEGRFDFANPAGPVMAWQAGRIRIDFEGDKLGLRFDCLDGQCFFDVQVDDAVWVLAVWRGRHQRIAFQRPLTPGRHHLTIFKRSEASAGTVRFKGIEPAAAAKAWSPEPVAYPLAMEFFGDSITVGACNEDGANDQWTNRLTHNCALSYATLTASAFSADYRNIAVSGMGIVTGYVKVRASQVWNRTGAKADSSLADLKAWQPDVVFVNYGENDDSFTTKQRRPFPAKFADGYVALIEDIRRAYPNARIVILRGGMFGGAKSDRLRVPWEAAVARLEARRQEHQPFRLHTLERTASPGVRRPRNGRRTHRLVEHPECRDQTRKMSQGQVNRGGRNSPRCWPRGCTARRTCASKGCRAPARRETPQALLRVKITGICGSDLHTYQDARIGDTPVTSPLILGHEFSGVVKPGRTRWMATVSGWSRERAWRWTPPSPASIVISASKAIPISAGIFAFAATTRTTAV